MTTPNGMRRRTITALAALAALAMPHGAHAQGTVEQQNVQIWTSRDAQQGVLPIVAARQGFFRDAGLNVEVRFVSSGSEIPAGMAGGTIPIAVAPWTNPMAMVANGLGVRILAPTTDISGAQQLALRPEANGTVEAANAASRRATGSGGGPLTP